MFTVELNDTKYLCRWNKAAVWSTFIDLLLLWGRNWRSLTPSLIYSKAEPYQRICPLGAPLNVLLEIAYCRKGCILHVSSGSPFHVFIFSLLHCRCFHLISTHKLLTILSQLDLKQAMICCWGSLNLKKKKKKWLPVLLLVAYLGKFKGALVMRGRTLNQGMWWVTIK